MADDKLQQKLADYVEDAHAMEQNDLKMIDSMATETAEVARRNRADEEEVARRINQSWDRTLELTLEENNIRA